MALQFHVPDEYVQGLLKASEGLLRAFGRTEGKEPLPAAALPAVLRLSQLQGRYWQQQLGQPGFRQLVAGLDAVAAALRRQAGAGTRTTRQRKAQGDRTGAWTLRPSSEPLIMTRPTQDPR